MRPFAKLPKDTYVLFTQYMHCRAITSNAQDANNSRAAPVTVHLEQRGVLWVQRFVDVDVDPAVRTETVVRAHQEVETGVPVNRRQQVEHLVQTPGSACRTQVQTPGSYTSFKHLVHQVEHRFKHLVQTSCLTGKRPSKRCCCCCR